MNTDTLWASMLWSAVGSGFAIYGKKQSRVVPMVGGLAMIGATYFCETALVMSLVSGALIAGIWWATKRGVGD
ncbi:MAG: amino acid transport protein [Verrucomicrobia bacterium]|nr:amino acid transport protein [Verrucomicrobiota bacterium]NBU09434.1 amino acid transport protein [Pseudomonadota bacterium]NDA66301.1 amino acid transport protein [Verrucomicrobiota bacterium]NDB75554.1 amino acid transport protein [Verrucomicrobiota bacterium]NDD38162.1 amino acid transport protein [Verrucomicrobiota bacterium]